MQPGDHIRDYRLERKLADGGMGEVWLARHGSLEKAVAIKALYEWLARDSIIRENLFAQANLLAAHQHPRIVSSHDFFEEKGQLFLVMQYVEGQSLEDRLDIARGPMPLEESLALSRDVLDGLEYVHQMGVVHNNVNPWNILIDRDNRANMAGFRIMNGTAFQHRRFSNPPFPSIPRDYFSPEKILLTPVDHRTDVYSFGCVLYEMLCGRPPFVADDEDRGDYQILLGHVKIQPIEPAILNPTIPPKVEAAILKALDKDPSKRLNNCGWFRQELCGTTRPTLVKPRLPILENRTTNGRPPG